jgi:hypothetical protein
VKNVSPSLRRILGLVVAMVAGTLATFVLATPASAHSSAISPSAYCDPTNGTWTVEWTVTNSQSDSEATLTHVVVTPSGTDAGDVANGALVPAKPGKLVGIQKNIPASTTRATLQEQSTWASDGFTEKYPQKKPVDFVGTCTQGKPVPTASFVSNCDGTVTGSLTNDKTAKVPATFTVTTTGAPKTYTVAIGATQTITTTAAESKNIAISAPGLSVTYSWKQPPNCVAATVSWKSDCTSLTVSVDNPAGNDPVDATITSGTNPPVKVSVPGGGSKSATFPATTGTSALVTFGAGAAAAAHVAAVLAAQATTPVTVSWVSPGATCNPPTSPPNLPVTGAKLGGVIGTGAVLIVVGAGLVLFLRRRRNIAPLQ